MQSWTGITETLATANNHQLKLTVTETSTSAANNTSTLQWTLECIRNSGSDTYVATAATTITINGIQVYYTGAHGWSEKVFPTCAGSTSGTITVAHDSNGAKTVTIGFTTRVYYSTVQSYGGSLALTTLDRTAPTVDFSFGTIGVNSIVVNATSNSSCNSWEYSLNGGGYVVFSSTSATSASTTITGLSAFTSYSIAVRAKKTANAIYGTSSSKSTKTLGGAIPTSVENFTLGASPTSESRSGYNSLIFNITKNTGTYYTRVSVYNGNTEIFHKDYGTDISSGTVTYVLPNNSTGISQYNSLKNIVVGAGTSMKLKVSNFTDSAYSVAYGDPVILAFTLYGDGNIFGPTIAPYSSTVNIRHEETIAAVISTLNDQSFVQNISRPKIYFGTVTPNAMTGASVVSYGVSLGNITQTFTTMPSDNSVTFTSGLTVTGSYLITITATDANGFTGSLTERVDILPYSALTVTNVSGARVGGTGTALSLSITGALSMLTLESVDYNAIYQVYYAYKKSNESTYSSYILTYQQGSASSTLSVSAANSEYTITSSAWSGSTTFDAGYSYNIKFKIIDKIGSYDESAIITIGQGTPTFSFRKIPGVSVPYVGVGKMSANSPLDVNGAINTSQYRLNGSSFMNHITINTSSSGPVTSSTSWTLAGNVTIPAYSYYTISATGTYAHSGPTGTKLSTSNSASAWAFASSNPGSVALGDGNRAVVTYSGMTASTAITIYIFAKWAVAGNSEYLVGDVLYFKYQ